jgi:uncharacterized protein YfaS (alpha-2-macroglobulin family)
LTVQASLQESGGRPITRRLEQPIWPAERLPGLRGLFDGEETDGDGPVEFEFWWPTATATSSPPMTSRCA